MYKIADHTVIPNSKMSSSEENIRSDESISSASSGSSKSSPSSPELNNQVKKKRRLNVFQPIRENHSNVSRHTLSRWENQGILVPVDFPIESDPTENADGEDLPNVEGENSQNQHNVRDLLEDTGRSSTGVESDCQSEHSGEQSAAFDSSECEDSDSVLSVESSESDQACSSDSSQSSGTTTKLFPGSPTSTAEAVLRLLDQYQKNRWSRTSLEGALDMVNSLLPTPHTMPKTVYHLFKYVENLAPTKVNETVYFYCSNCQYFIGTEPEECEVCNKSDHHQFYGFSVKDQVKFLFENRNLAHILDKYDVSASTQENVISDICCGEEYQKVKVPGRYNITLLWNTDGVSSFGGSSKGQLWPLQYIICELPPCLRKQYMIVCGVWYDEFKPPMNTFLKPFVDCLVGISDEGGVEWRHPTTSEVCKSSVIAPSVCADAPVRAEAQNLQHHNGEFGCNTCEQKRERISEREAQESGSKRRPFFLYQREQACLRTKQSMDEQGLRAASNKKNGLKCYHVKGVKGPSVISLIPSLDRAACVYPEYMHGVCLGVVRQFIVLYFFSQNDFWEEGINSTDLVNNYLINIAPLDYMRVPRFITDYKLWRAHEFRAWLLFFSLPSVSKYLKPQYVQHWMLLVIAVYLLLQNEISFADLSLAEHLLKLFLEQIRTLYGSCVYTYNVHQLLHLSLSVKRWGPLWATSAFQFENSNGVLSNLIHGTNRKGIELINSLKLCQGIHVLRNCVKRGNGDFYEKHVHKLLNERVEVTVTRPDLLQVLSNFADLQRPFFFSSCH